MTLEARRSAQRHRSKTGRIISLLALATLVAGCNNTSDTNNSGAAADRPAGVATGSDNAVQASWTVSQAADPMNDVVMHAATTTLDNAGYKAAARIECGGDRVSYTLDVVHQDGSPAPMLVNYGRIAGQYRLGDGPALTMSQIPTAVANRFTFFDTDPKLPNANQLIVRMSLAEGPATFTIDQADPTLRPMLKQCASTMQARIEADDASEVAYARERFARCGDHACPIIPPDDQGSRASTSPPPTMSDAELERVDEWQGRLRLGDSRADCPALLARHAKFEDEVAQRDAELEAEEPR